MPGEHRSIGRAIYADLSVPSDDHLRRLSLTCVAGQTAVTCITYPAPAQTLLNGNPVEAAELKDGDHILVGETEFLVHWEGPTVPVPAVLAARATPTPIEPPKWHSVPSAVKPTVLDYLRSVHDPLFAVIDAAREQYALDLLRQSKEEYKSLYEGADDEIADWGPWLVRLPPTSPLLKSLVAEGWGQSWGIYLTCDRPFAEVRKHLRRFLTVKLPDGDQVLFRFYDPRVIRVFLTSCTPEETTEFFGPISEFLLEPSSRHPLAFQPGDRNSYGTYRGFGWHEKVKMAMSSRCELNPFAEWRHVPNAAGSTGSPLFCGP